MPGLVPSARRPAQYALAWILSSFYISVILSFLYLGGSLNICGLHGTGTGRRGGSQYYEDVIRGGTLKRILRFPTYRFSYSIGRGRLREIGLIRVKSESYTTVFSAPIYQWSEACFLPNLLGLYEGGDQKHAVRLLRYFVFTRNNVRLLARDY